MPDPLITFLKKFRDVSPDEGLIMAAAEQRSYKEGEVLLKENTIPREIFFIYNGVLKITSVNDKGADVTYFFLKENQFCTILQSFQSQQPARESIVAACDVEVMAISRVKLYELYAQRPYIEELINSIVQRRLLEKIQIRNSYMGQDAATRYRIFMEQEPELALRVPLADIASYLCITPQSLSRIRKNIR